MILPTVYIGLGSNVGDRAANLRQAVLQIAAQDIVSATSNIYESEPVGYSDQGKFWNMVIEVRSHSTPQQLLDRLLAIENQLGRQRTFRNAPRNIDLDILLYGDVVLHTPALHIPHPRMRERAFVLRPLVELAPDLADPVTNQRYRDILADGQFEHIELVQPFED